VGGGKRARRHAARDTHKRRTRGEGRCPLSLQKKKKRDGRSNVAITTHRHFLSKSLKTRPRAQTARRATPAQPGPHRPSPGRGGGPERRPRPCPAAAAAAVAAWRRHPRRRRARRVPARRAGHPPPASPTRPLWPPHQTVGRPRTHPPRRRRAGPRSRSAGRPGRPPRRRAGRGGGRRLGPVVGRKNGTEKRKREGVSAFTAPGCWRPPLGTGSDHAREVPIARTHAHAHAHAPHAPHAPRPCPSWRAGCHQRARRAGRPSSAGLFPARWAEAGERWRARPPPRPTAPTRRTTAPPSWPPRRTDRRRCACGAGE